MEREEEEEGVDLFSWGKGVLKRGGRRKDGDRECRWEGRRQSKVFQHYPLCIFIYSNLSRE